VLLTDINGITQATNVGTGFKAFVYNFSDVPPSDFFWKYVEAIFSAGVTTGCNPGQTPLNYCPFNNVTRAQMAAFLIRAKYGNGYIPPDPIGVFADVNLQSTFARYIEQAYNDGITTGCNPGQTPLNYCPNDNVTRAQMAAFLVRTKKGGGFTPPPPTGVFADVNLQSTFAKYIEDIYRDGVTTGCNPGQTPLNYCPGDFVLRRQMAAFLQRNFGFTLP